MATQRSQVLSMYRKILRVARTWSAQDVKNTEVEKKFIREEAETLFRKNKELVSVQDVQERLLEAQARLDLAVHYRNPYPRPVNLPPQSYVKREGRKDSKVQERQKRTARPIYIRTLDKDR